MIGRISANPLSSQLKRERLKQKQLQEEEKIQLNINFYRSVLGWDYFSKKNFPPSFSREDESEIRDKLNSSKQLTEIEYLKKFEDLNLLECWAQLTSQGDKEAEKPFRMKMDYDRKRNSSRHSQISSIKFSYEDSDISLTPKFFPSDLLVISLFSNYQTKPNYPSKNVPYFFGLITSCTTDSKGIYLLDVLIKYSDKSRSLILAYENEIGEEQWVHALKVST